MNDTCLETFLAAGNRIREINPESTEEVLLVATRMRKTLVEVLGEEAGGNLYSMDWLQQRVLWHLDPTQCVGQVFLFEDSTGHICGHTIVRLERDDKGDEFGLFSTTYVELEYRNRAVATSLVARGEKWIADHGMNRSMTYTAESNTKLKRLFFRLGYQIVATHNDMVALSKSM